ncbi:threonine efflux protein [Bosea sp. BE125]|uniref:LysE family translocator n=1 Tax=Bosea sp. BE125 TaxID=2817909 RepID=UPI0028664857|nr:LysE family translocator [Bosea sp. BE125]MDR6871362.1 threonine efflux protein [Bosea sp. BE125]
MNQVTILAGIAAIHALAIASPGPTFAVVMSYAVKGDRRAGLLLSFGVVLATLTWAFAAAAGLGTLLASFPLAYRGLQLIGAAYLIYLGAKLLLGILRQKGPAAPHATSKPVSGLEAIRAGFITNITNPKVVAYYASLFGVMIPAGAPGWLFWSAVAVVVVVSAAWWIAVTLFFTVPAVSRAYVRAKPVLDVIMGVVLIALGLRLAVFG